MGMGCGMSLIKYVLFVFNLLCALCGIALVALGVVYIVEMNDVEKLFENHNAAAAPIVLIVFGAIIFVIAFFGCCGAIRESHCMTLTYSFFLLVLIIGQIALGAIVLVKSEDIGKAIKNVFEKEIWDKKGETANKDLIDVIQKNLKCCGVNGPIDYVLPLVPDSCCKELTFNQCPVTSAYSTGCSQKINEWIQNAGKIIGIVALAVAAIELVGFIFACCLANSIRNQERRYA